MTKYCLFVKSFLVILIYRYATADGMGFSDFFNLDHLPDEAALNFTTLATKYGYPPTEHEVITEDGYILTLFRIPGKSRYPVLLMHGILDSADTWLIRGENSLVITLANAGYDVWCGNSRGNRYSRRHLNLNPDNDTLFWNYSFHDVGYYDLPAIIDSILKITNAPSLSAVGHSQGTTAFFVLGSTRPEYNDRVNVMVALAPVCYLHHSPPPISTFTEMIPVLKIFFNLFNINEFLGYNDVITKISRKVCPAPLVGYTICLLGIIFPFTGYDMSELEPAFLPTLSYHFPAGTSTKSLIHYLQVGKQEIFGQFDYGPDDNRFIYNSTTPPAYDLSRVTMPIALLAAKNDFLSMLPDVDLLRGQLQNVIFYFVNPRADFNHLDHVWGRHMRNYTFPHVLQLLESYNGFD